MTKNEFIASLRKALSALPDEDINKHIEYYSEMIDDRIEDGCSEEEAVAFLGSIDKIAKDTLPEVPLLNEVKTKIKKKIELKKWQAVLLIITSPIWGALVLAFGITAVVLYFVIWVLVIVLYVLTLSFAVVSLALLFASIPAFLRGNPAQSVVIFGAALIMAGLSILMFITSFYSSKASVLLGRKIISIVK